MNSLFMSTRKIIIVGSSSIGKTSIINRYISDTFVEEHLPTVGAGGVVTKNVTDDNGHPMILEIWDTAGQERYRSIARTFYKGANIAFVCFDFQDEYSISQIDSFVSVIKDEADCILYLVATKTDLLESEEKVEDFLEEKKDDVFQETFQTSSLTGKGVNDLFNFAINQQLAHPIDPIPPKPELQDPQDQQKKCC